MVLETVLRILGLLGELARGAIEQSNDPDAARAEVLATLQDLQTELDGLESRHAARQAELDREVPIGE